MDTTQSAYDQIAGRFSELTAVMPAPVAAGAQAFLDRLGTSGWLLDLGCGPGRDLAWFEAHGSRAAGADFSAGMLSQARKKTGYPLLQMDLRALGIQTRTIQGIWCNAALLHLPKSEAIRALEEMRRVLSAGGLLAITVQEGTGEGYEMAPFGDVQRFFSRYSMEELSEMLIRTGFGILKAEAVLDGSRADVRWLWFLAEAGK
jgi:ubiquinone/menaquinone biosynthesis C-methylase UbiE